MTKEIILKNCLLAIGDYNINKNVGERWAQFNQEQSTIAIYRAMDEYAKPYIEIADLISRIFYYGNFKAETHNERILEQRLRQVGLWPTTEDEIIQRPEIQFIEQQNKDNGVENI